MVLASDVFIAGLVGAAGIGLFDLHTISDQLAADYRFNGGNSMTLSYPTMVIIASRKL